MKLFHHHIDFLKNYFYQKTAISIGNDKVYLLENRLAPVIRKFGFKSFDDITNAIKNDNKQVISECIDAISTNETYFFRDIKPFKVFDNIILPKLINKPQPIIRIWSAACSSGQEPYSIAISMLENSNNLKGKKFQILATDISGKVLRKAEEGVYSSFEIQRGLPAALMIKYFDKIEGNNWKIKDTVKKYVTFKELNLTEDISQIGMFDCIFCRYVLIYFDDAGKKNITMKIAERLESGGAFILGTSETQNSCPEIFNQYQELRSVFFKN